MRTLRGAAQDDLERAGVGWPGEHVVGLVELIQCEVVGDEPPSIDLVSGEQAQQGRRGVRVDQAGRDGDVPGPLVLGVHGEPATLHLEELWIKNITITTGLVDAYSTATLLDLLATHQIDAGRFVTHHFTLDEFDAAYDVFGRAADTGALKVVLSRTA